jgi:hypothetical protein
MATEETTDETPTEIFLPEFHFPQDKCEVEVSAGKWAIATDDRDGGLIQKLKWWHLKGEHTIKVTGLRRAQQLGLDEEEGYLDQCQQNNCSIM